MIKTKLKIKPVFQWLSHKNEGKFDKPTLKTTTVLINGKLATCILLSIVSGVIDLTFFSGLSKTPLPIAAIFIPASVLYSLMSIGFTMGKFFCAMQLGAINELKTRIKNAGYEWYKNLNRIAWKWHAVHKFLIGVSVITSISLSFISIDDGVRKNGQERQKISEAKIRIEKYANTSEKSDDIQFQNLVTTSSATSQAGMQANQLADQIWPIIEDYRQERSDFQSAAAFDSKDPIEWKGQTIVPDEYWDARNNKVVNDVKVYRTMSLWQIRNTTSKAALANTIKTEIEESYSSSSSDQLTALADKSTEKAKQEIQNLAGRFTWPDGTVAEFDENNVSGALTTLSDLASAWLDDTGDLGASAKMFLLVGPTLDKMMDKRSGTLEQVANSSGSIEFNGAQILMIILICVFGIVQEFLIALFTPKSTISRKMLYQFDAYFEGDFNLNRFCLTLYLDYYNKGIISKEDFEAKVKKCVELLQNTEDKIIERYTKKDKDPASELRRLQDELKQAKEEVSQSQEKIAQLKQSLQNSDEKMKEFLGAISVSNVPQASKKRVIADNAQTGYSDAVTKAVEEVENLLKS